MRPRRGALNRGSAEGRRSGRVGAPLAFGRGSSHIRFRRRTPAPHLAPASGCLVRGGVAHRGGAPECDRAVVPPLPSRRGLLAGAARGEGRLRLGALRPRGRAHGRVERARGGDGRTRCARGAQQTGTTGAHGQARRGRGARRASEVGGRGASDAPPTPRRPGGGRAPTGPARVDGQPSREAADRRTKKAPCERIRILTAPRRGIPRRRRSRAACRGFASASSGGWKRARCRPTTPAAWRRASSHAACPRRGGLDGGARGAQEKAPAPGRARKEEP